MLRAVLRALSSPDDTQHVCVESRDPSFVPCCWLVRHLDPGCAATVQVRHARDPRRRRVVLLADECEGTAWLGDAALRYRVEVVGPPLPTDHKPEAFRRLHLSGRAAAVDAFVTKALDEYAKVTGLADEDECEDGVEYWTWTDDAWCKSRRRRSRPLSTLFLPEGAGDVVQDFRAFCAPESLATYRRLHVAPTRLYMLHGVPGSGKSSLVHCVASETRHGVASMSFGPGVTDADVRAALTSVPRGCVVCVEDVDGLFADGRRPCSGLTFAGLLAALDECGNEREATGVFLTTNRLCALDPALRRRLDYVAEFGYATEAQARRMHAHFFPLDAGFAAFWERVCHRRFSMSTLQKYFVRALRRGHPHDDLEYFDSLASCADASDPGTWAMYT